MSVVTTKRIAADILGVGESRVRIDPDNFKRADEALTRDDVRRLIVEHVVYVTKSEGVSRAIGRKRHSQKKRGRMRGTGRRAGKKHARTPKKEAWMAKVRAQRKKLLELRLSGKLAEGAYRKIYNMVKGGAFRSTGAMMTHLTDNEMVKK